MSDWSLNDCNWDHWQTIRLHPSLNVAKVIDALLSAGADVQRRAGSVSIGVAVMPVGDGPRFRAAILMSLGGVLAIGTRRRNLQPGSVVKPR
jgi:hypothetical protein